MWLLVAFIAVPLIEIALFITIGGAIGLFPTLATVVLTALLGSWLVRSQGAQALQDIGQSFNEMRDPTKPLADGAMILFSGALLLTPGFFTDALGFLLLVPSFRMMVYKWARERVTVQTTTTFTTQGGQQTYTRPSGGSVIDGEFTEVESDHEPDPNAPPSGWTRH